MTLSTHLRRNLVRAFVILLVLVIGWTGWQGFRVWRAWRNVDRIPFDVAAAREAIGQQGTTTLPTSPADEPADPVTTLPPQTTTTAPAADPDLVDAFLVIGSDQRPADDSRRADVIIMVLLPTSGGDPLMISIPRDLYLPNPCTGGPTRINATLNGCGQSATGPELLSMALEDWSGIRIDHFVIFDFNGFKKVIDRVGGVEICVTNPVRELGLVELPAGCSVAGGATALGWVRSRHTEELVDGVWRAMPGAGALARDRRQQDILLQALRRLKDFRSVTQFSALVEELSDAFTIDDGLSLGDAIGLAWDMRDLDIAAIRRPTIPVSDYTTPEGAMVMLAEAPFAEVLESAYPGASAILAGS